ncbi:MAG TPA: HD domain-containing phosphohydrolase [Longimicrobiales bacterium]|nr:HD domain-containing phosphohydrolase [Longimicrobiales bacterium]
MTPQTYTVDSTAALQRQGQRFLATFYAALQSMKLFPLENQTVQKALDDLHAAALAVAEREEVIELGLVGDFIFINDVRLRLDLSTYAAFSLVSTSFTRHGIGTVEVRQGVGRDEWPPFLSLLLQKGDRGEDPYKEFVARMAGSPVRNLQVGPERERAHLDEDDNASKEAAKRAYFQTVEVAKNVLNDTRLGKSVNARRVKRAVQSIVDQVLNNETSIMGMTALREYDDYTFTHCVNVCIFAVVLGQKLGLDKLQLYELGLGALFHDLGKMRVDADITNKPGALTDEEFRQMQQHTTEGMLALFNMHGFGEVPFRAMLMAYEHHMKLDLTGYPKNTRPRDPTLFSRIVAVADGFDAATTQRSYQAVPWRPEEALKEMRDNPRRGYDPLLVKALINVTGIFPVGTLAILDTYEMAVVTAPNPDPSKINQPIVKIIYDEMGNPLAEPVTVNLAEAPADGGHQRRIIKTTRPERYGIDVGAYFL